jgi:sugar phosphate isomerase/epimerase
MEFGVSSFGWHAEPLDAALLERIRRSGWGKIELFANRPHLEYTNSSVRRDLADWFSGSDIRKPDLHLPFQERIGPRGIRWISALHAEERERQYALDETRRALELADSFPVENVVVHLGLPRQPFGPVLFDYAYRLVETIRSFADVHILLETLENEIATPARLLEFLEVARFDAVDICHDVAHTRLDDAVGDRVARIHLSDPAWGADSHRLGDNDDRTWAALVETLVRGDYRGDVVFEVAEMDLDRIGGVRSRIVDLTDEARTSLEEFRNRHRLAHPVSEEE